MLRAKLPAQQDQSPPRMKRFIVLFLLTAGLCAAEDAKLVRNTVMRQGNSLVMLKAGTVVHILEHGDKTVTVKVDGKTGTIPWSGLDPLDDGQPVTHAPTPGTVSATSAATAPAATVTPPPADTPPAPHKAQTMYGKMVEKARDTTDAHEKALVHPTDEVLDGK
jgi:hypothetical protein